MSDQLIVVLTYVATFIVGIVMLIIFYRILDNILAKSLDHSDEKRLIVSSLTGLILGFGLLIYFIVSSIYSTGYLLLIIMGVPFIAFIPFAAIYLLKNYNKEKYFALFPLFIAIVFILLLAFLPKKISLVYYQNKFNNHYEQYSKAAIEIVKAQNQEMDIVLPQKYGKISVDNKVEVYEHNETKYVLFIVHYGDFDLYNAFLYSSQSKIKNIQNHQVTKLKPNWYLISGNLEDKYRTFKGD